VLGIRQCLRGFGVEHRCTKGEHASRSYANEKGSPRSSLQRKLTSRQGISLIGRSSPSLEAIENIANTLEVELQDLFDYMHLDPERVAPKESEESLDGIDGVSRKLLTGSRG